MGDDRRDPAAAVTARDKAVYGGKGEIVSMDHDQDILARTLWGEARGEGVGGLEAVASVIMNRVAMAKSLHRKMFGDGSAASACLVPFQFSCWLAKDPNLAKLKAVGTADPVFVQCQDIAARALAGTLPDAVNGATHYYERHMPVPPAWARGHSPCAALGNHLFFGGV